MSVIRQGNWLGQQRVDLPHVRAMESSICGDFDVLAGDMLTGGSPMVVTGFNALVTNDTIGSAASSLQISVAGAKILHSTASESGTLFSVPDSRDAETLNTANARVSGGFTANAVNYVGVDIRRSADSSTSSTVKFLNASTEQETSNVVPLGRTLDYVFYISTVDFSVNPTLAPVCKVTTDASNNITEVVDARSLWFRLGTGGSIPDAQYAFPWSGDRSEAGDNSDFTVGDKAITSLKEWMDALMTRVWEIGGGEYWYSATADRNVRMIRSGATFTNGEWFEWDGTHLHWKGIKFVFDNSTGSVNTVTDQTGDSSGLTDLADGECIYVDLDRTQDTTVTALKASVLNLGTPTVPGSRYVIAWRVGSTVYTRDSSFPVGATFDVATDVSLGLVQLTSAALNPAVPLVVPVGANGVVYYEGTDALEPAFKGVGGAGGPGLYGIGGTATGNGVEGNGTGTGIGVYGLGGSTGAGGTGVYGEGAGTDGNGVEGWGKIGVIGYSSGGSSPAILGDAVTGGGTGNGVNGTGGTGGAGVQGQGGASSGTGVRGTGGASNGVGVLGQGDGTGYGVHGIGGDSNAAGVRGEGGTTNGKGVDGLGSGTGTGVLGTGGGTSGIGVEGVGGASNGIGGKFTGDGTGEGVYATGGDNSGIGVHAFGGATNGTAIKGEASGTGHGVHGVASTGYGVVAQGHGSGGASGKAALRVVPQTAVPSSAAEGDVCADDTNNTLNYYDGSAWVPLNRAVDVQTFNAAGSPHTWTKPTLGTPKSVTVICIGGGGGGGSGGVAAAGGVRTGGGGGGGGAVTICHYVASLLGDTETVTVGAGGAGGGQNNGPVANGQAGTDGGTSSFGTWQTAGGGGGGTAGQSSASSTIGGGGGGVKGASATSGGQPLVAGSAISCQGPSGNPGSVGFCAEWGGGSGGGNTNAGTAGSNGGSSLYAAGGGGAGGGLTAADAASAGGTGGAVGSYSTGGGGAGSSGNAGVSTPGTAGDPNSTFKIGYGGKGGGGGGSHYTGISSGGGDGGFPGGGGGGSGASVSTTGAAPAAGSGADGVVYVITYF